MCINHVAGTVTALSLVTGRPLKSTVVLDTSRGVQNIFGCPQVEHAVQFPVLQQIKMSTVICHDIYGKQHETPAKSLQWRPATYVVLIKHASVCLLKAVDGNYDLPGGAIELGEDPKAAAIREVKEETGLDVDEPTLLGIQSSLFRASHSDGRCYHSLLMYYHCTNSTGTVSNEGFDEYEKQHMELAEWVPMAGLGNIKVGSTVDFRPYVWQAYRVGGPVE